MSFKDPLQLKEKSSRRHFNSTDIQEKFFVCKLDLILSEISIVIFPKVSENWYSPSSRDLKQQPRNVFAIADQQLCTKWCHSITLYPLRAPTNASGEFATIIGLQRPCSLPSLLIIWASAFSCSPNPFTTSHLRHPHKTIILEIGRF